MTDHSAARDAHRERESLVDAAWRQIAAHGSDLSTEQADEQIAADAGVSVERLHHHFPSGPDLALGVVDRLYSEMMALRLRCTDGWGTQQQAQVTWRNFVHDVAGLGMGDIFARVTPETVRVLGPELRSAAIPRQQRMNREIEAVLQRARDHGLITDNVTGPSFLMGIGMISRPVPPLPESMNRRQRGWLTDIYLRGMRPE
ncbi:TetR/AcrR family transcriptional regulator [Corynebacterium variabile]|uniref:TetR/AcrR family transcriptional regulator n=1 Tax=Corynebacterium variabile TaxID=1727 RepID=UPI003A94BD6E